MVQKNEDNDLKMGKKMNIIHIMEDGEIRKSLKGVSLKATDEIMQLLNAEKKII